MIPSERLSALFGAHAARLVLYARQWLERAAAEDVVQEVFVRLTLQIREPVSAKAWLYKSVRNEAISHMRSFWRRQRRERAQPREEWFEPDCFESVDAASASEALQTLPAAQREAIVLRIWGHMTLKEIAAVTGSSISSVFDHYRAGIGALRERMGEPCQNKND